MLFLYALVLLLLGWCAAIDRRQNRLDGLSLYDPMTGLLSGRVFTCERWPAAIRQTDPLAILYVDLDELRKRNNHEGHAAGDAYILRAAQHLQRRRGVDQVFRVYSAGDEFVILLLGTDALHAERFAWALQRDLQAAGISASIGAVLTDSHAHTTRTAVLAAAEAAMREAKANKGSVVFRRLSA